MSNLSAVLTWKHPTTVWSIRDNVVVEFSGGIPDDDTLSSWANEYEAAKPWADLRNERNLRLAETDWWASSDLTMTDERKLYRDALRDFPATVNIANIVWPNKPTGDA